MERNGGSSASYLGCTLCVPCFVLCSIAVETEGLLDYQGRAGIISIVRWNPHPVIFGLGALKETELRWQREPKTQIFAENRRSSQIRPFSWKFQHLEGAENRRKPQISQETEDFRREPQETQIGFRHLRSVTLARPYSASTHWCTLHDQLSDELIILRHTDEREFSRRTKRKGTNGAKFAVFFRRFSLIFADFRFSWEFRHFGVADFRRKPQETKDFIADWNLSSTELESDNAPGAFLQTAAPVLAKFFLDPWVQHFYPVLGCSLPHPHRERERECNSSQHLHWIEISLPDYVRGGCFEALQQELYNSPPPLYTLHPV